MAVSVVFSYTLTGGAWVLDIGQDDYEIKRELMVPFGNRGESLHPGEDTDLVEGIMQLSYPKVVMEFGATEPMETARTRIEDVLMDARTFGFSSAGKSATDMQTSGIYDAQTFDLTSASGLDSSGRYLQQDSSSSSGSDVGGDTFTFPHRRELGSEVLHKFALLHTTDVRFFAVTLANMGITNILGSDTPTSEYVGVRYSTGAGDTKFRFVSSNGTGSNDVDSGVAISTDPRLVHIIADDSVPNYTVRILDDSFDELASTVFTANIPGASTDLGAGVALKTLASGVKSIKQYFWKGVNKK